MAAIDDWRAATALRDKIKTLKDFSQVNGNDVFVTVSAVQTKIPGGAPASVDEAVKAYIAQIIQGDLRGIINNSLNAAKADVTAKAVLARDEAQAVLRDAV